MPTSETAWGACRMGMDDMANRHRHLRKPAMDYCGSDCISLKYITCGECCMCMYGTSHKQYLLLTSLHTIPQIAEQQNADFCLLTVNHSKAALNLRILY